MSNHIKANGDICPECDSVYGLWRRKAVAVLAILTPPAIIIEEAKQ